MEQYYMNLTSMLPPPYQHHPPPKLSAAVFLPLLLAHTNVVYVVPKQYSRQVHTMRVLYVHIVYIENNINYSEFKQSVYLHMNRL